MLATVFLRGTDARVEIVDYDSFEVDLDSAIALEEMINEGLSFRDALVASESGALSILNELLPYVTDDWERLHNLVGVEEGDSSDNLNVVAAGGQ